jgi:hypothetical protein
MSLVRRITILTVGGTLAVAAAAAWAHPDRGLNEVNAKACPTSEDLPSTPRNTARLSAAQQVRAVRIARTDPTVAAVLRRYDGHLGWQSRVGHSITFGPSLFASLAPSTLGPSASVRFTLRRPSGNEHSS